MASELVDILNNDMGNKLILSILTCVATVAAKYLKDLAHSIEIMSKDVTSLNKELAVIVHQIQSHEKRLDHLESKTK